MATQFFDRFRKFVSLFSQKEVKTPLSLSFRAMLYVVLVAGVMIVWGQPRLQEAVFFSFILMVVLILAVAAVFAWCRPRNLVYGERGYRAETRLSLGTERAELTAGEVGSLEGTQKPIELQALEEPKRTCAFC